MKGVGRPLKYLYILYQLEDDKLYKPSTLADIPDWSGLTDEERKKKRTHVRLAMRRLAQSRDFPIFGDGRLSQPGQPPTPAWFGWRWRNAADLEIPK